MFTGSKTDDLIKRAEEKALAKEPPVTFLGKEGVSMLQEIAQALPLLRTLELSALAMLSEECIWVLKSAGCWDRQRLKSHQSSCGIIDTKEFGLLLSGLFFLIKAALKQRVPVETIRHDLKNLRFKDDHIQSLVSLIHSERFKLELVSKDLRIKHPRLNRLKWRIDLTISSAKVKSVLVPTVTLQMVLSNGRIISMELSQKKFSTLRYNVAKVLSQMQELNRHPMIQIMNQLETEERRLM